ncbi:MAG: hypothetical protein WAM04_13435 [Candidatus Sulfotelmatobacter sp.]
MSKQQDMSDHIKPENSAEHESFEHQDLKAAGIVYFLLTLVVLIMLSMFGLRGLYAYLDRREKASQPAVNPLVTSVPEDTLHIAPGYPQTAFPSPKLEEDERGQLNGIRLQQDDILYTYGWVDEKAGTVHIPIERAMDLLVQRGLPLRPQGAADESPAAKADTGKSKTTTNKGEKK